MTGQREAIESVTMMSLSVIRMFDWLLDLYVLDYFVDDHWNKLPKCWRDCFDRLSPLSLGHIIMGTRIDQVFPLSFLALLKTVQVLSVPRKDSFFNETISNKCKNNDICNDCSNHPKLRNLFLKHVKLKKRHEITLMSDVVKNVAEQSQCKAAIDFGSGMGHLVRVLAYKKHLNTAGIECQNQLTEEARKLDRELEYTAKKFLSEKAMESLVRPLHFNITLTSHEQLISLNLPNRMKPYGLVGLHPCGDLGPLLLRHFVQYDEVKFICVVGCCYMKLTKEGYPMSSHVKTLNNALSYPSREIACHAIEVYCERLVADNFDDLKVHAYRAALERILVEHDPKLKHAPVRSIKHTNSMTFEQYCHLAVNRIHDSVPFTPQVLRRGYTDIQQWRRVVTVYTLRLILAPLVETVVLLDRVLYVLQYGLQCEIHPVFDPKISARNHIIIGRRL